MTYADTDFFLALLKPSDWLKERAKRILKRYDGRLTTSEVTYIELMLLAKRYGLDVQRLFADVMAICHEDNPLYLNAASFFEHGLGVFDSFHAAHVEDEILSSDAAFERAGLMRVPIEEE